MICNRLREGGPAVNGHGENERDERVDFALPRSTERMLMLPENL